MKNRLFLSEENQASHDCGVERRVELQPDLFDCAAPTALLLPPRYPPSRDSVVANFLVLLLEGRHLTSNEVKAECGSSRAAHHAYALGRLYGWPIQTEPWDEGSKDGRIEQIVRYYLGPAVISEALACGAKGFMQETRRARAKLRLSAPQKYRQAEERNASRLCKLSR